MLADPAWNVVATGDLNGDGKSDLIWYNAQTGTTYAWLMNGTSISSYGALLTDPAWSVVATGDLNGDGKSDLIWYNAQTGTTYVWLMNGTSISSHGALLTDPAWNVVATGDLNGDGKSDLIWYNAATGTTYAWLMNGTSVSVAWRLAHRSELEGDRVLNGRHLLWPWSSRLKHVSRPAMEDVRPAEPGRKYSGPSEALPQTVEHVSEQGLARPSVSCPHCVRA